MRQRTVKIFWSIGWKESRCINEKGARKFLFQIGLFTVIMLLTFWFVFRSQDISRTA